MDSATFRLLNTIHSAIKGQHDEMKKPLKDETPEKKMNRLFNILAKQYPESK